MFAVVMFAVVMFAVVMFAVVMFAVVMFAVVMFAVVMFDVVMFAVVMFAVSLNVYTPPCVLADGELSVQAEGGTRGFEAGQTYRCQQRGDMFFLLFSFVGYLCLWCMGHTREL